MLSPRACRGRGLNWRGAKGASGLHRCAVRAVMARVVRGYRCAQPPATDRHRFAMGAEGFARMPNHECRVGGVGVMAASLVARTDRSGQRSVARLVGGWSEV